MQTPHRPSSKTSTKWQIPLKWRFTFLEHVKLHQAIFPCSLSKTSKSSHIFFSFPCISSPHLFPRPCAIESVHVFGWCRRAQTCIHFYICFCFIHFYSHSEIFIAFIVSLFSIFFLFITHGESHCFCVIIEELKCSFNCRFTHLFTYWVQFSAPFCHCSNTYVKTNERFRWKKWLEAREKKSSSHCTTLWWYEAAIPHFPQSIDDYLTWELAESAIPCWNLKMH